MSYPISANVQSYQAEGYNKDKPLIVSSTSRLDFSAIFKQTV